jgi:hypothetical protein
LFKILTQASAVRGKAKYLPLTLDFEEERKKLKKSVYDLRFSQLWL